MSKSKKRRADQPRRAWLTKAEAAKIDALAEPLGGFAALIRAELLGRRPRASKYDLAALARLSAHIGKIGSNVNQLAKRANEGRFNADAIEDAMRDVQELRAVILEHLGEDRPPPGDDPE